MFTYEPGTREGGPGGRHDALRCGKRGGEVGVRNTHVPGRLNVFVGGMNEQKPVALELGMATS